MILKFHPERRLGLKQRCPGTRGRLVTLLNSICLSGGCQWQIWYINPTSAYMMTQERPARVRVRMYPSVETFGRKVAIIYIEENVISSSELKYIPWS